MVVADEPREGRDPSEERLKDRELPLHVDVPGPVRLPHDVDGSRAGGLIRDVRSVRRSRVARLQIPHARILSSPHPGVQVGRCSDRARGDFRTPNQDDLRACSLPLDHPVEMPAVGDTLKFVLAGLVEFETGTGSDVLHRL